MNKDLAKFNTMVREWADRQPAKYRHAALAFGYRCDTETHSFSGTLEWVSRLSWRYGYGVSRATLVRHLRVFREHGVITVERRRKDDKNMSSVYHVDFDRYIGDTPEEQAPVIVETPVIENDTPEMSAVEPAKSPVVGKHNSMSLEFCKICSPLIESGEYTEDELWDVHGNSWVATSLPAD